VPSRTRAALRVASSSALALLTLAGLAAAGAHVTVTQANAPAPTRPAVPPLLRRTRRRSASGA